MSSDAEMTNRLSEEFRRLNCTKAEIARKLGTSPVVVYNWLSGHHLPQAFFLAGLYRLGCDVIYILTGERTRNDQARSEDNR